MEIKKNWLRVLCHGTQKFNGKTKDEWMYGPYHTTPELDKKIKEVEKALGFKLFIWQKTYIETGIFRKYGATTAAVLKLLITEGEIINFTKPPQGNREQFFRSELLKIKNKLDEAGVKTNKVFTNKEELHKEMNIMAERIRDEKRGTQHGSNDYQRYNSRSIRRKG